MSDVLVLVEHHNNEVDTFSLQLLNKGRHLADQLGVGLGALILGSDLDMVVENVCDKGVDVVFTLDNPEITPYNPEIFSKAVVDIMKPANPQLLLMGYTILGMEIAPIVAVRAGVRLISNCTDIDLSPEGLPIVSRPMYSEMVHARLKTSLPLIVSIRKGKLSGKELLPGEAKRVPVASKLDLDSVRTKVISVLEPAIGEIDLTKAQLIVAVGRGIKKATNIELAKRLAEALGGVIAGSRPVIDLGWLSPAYQVGLSGMSVSPQVYIACGISGAAQHTAGMSDSQMIIAINEDPDAPIFRVANYGIVGDLFEIMPVLIESAEQSGIRS